MHLSLGGALERVGAEQDLELGQASRGMFVDSVLDKEIALRKEWDGEVRSSMGANLNLRVSVWI